MQNKTNAKIIDQIFAFIATGENGDEGITGFLAKDKTWMPMVGADIDRVNSLEALAQHIANETKSEIKLLFFSKKELVKVFKPE